MPHHQDRRPRRAALAPTLLAAALLLGAPAVPGCATTEPRAATPAPTDDRETIRAAFDRWRNRTGGPFELLADDAEWTIAGSSPLSKTYRSKRQFMDEVINPFNARVAKPLTPTIRGLYADADTVIVHFDAEAPTKAGWTYRNTYAWFLQMRDGRIARATAFFDTRLFDDLWARVPPSP